MRRILSLAGIIILAFSCCAFADASLYRGSGSIGSVQTLESSSGYLVSVEDAGRLFGFSASRSGDELLLTRGGSQLRLILKSAAAWRGFSIVPLYSAPFESKGKVWLDPKSVEAIFQNFAGSGNNNRLRFLQDVGISSPKSAALSALELGIPDAETSEQNVTASAVLPSLPAASVQAEKVTEQVKTAPQTVKAQIESKTQQVSSQAQVQAAQITEKVKPTPAVAQTVTQSQTLSSAAPVIAAAVDEKTKIQEVKTASATSAKPAKKQPRLETFRPGDTNKDKDAIYSGNIQRIRWTDSDGTYNKIMAVVETDENADPQVYISGASIHALFSQCPENAEGLTSPYANITTEIKRNDSGVEIIFTPSKFTKAEKLVLNNPRRIAFDFFFPENVAVARAGSQPVQTVRKPPEIPTVPAVTLTPRTPSPAVTTPPSTITIPMTPAGRMKRKTIVIDPGHGGKDPGASDNGVVEKNVNLAVGLELEKALSARGYRVVMTRNTDVYLTLQERTDIANRENADLFVSVHVNALPNKKSMTGFEIYIMALPTDKDAMNLAKVENREYVEGKGMDVANVDRRTEMLLKILGDMQQNNKISESTDFAAALYNAGILHGLQMRRIAQAPFFVLRGAGMPAVLLELGFVTNAAESKLLTTQNYQKKIADAMTAGIMNYLK